MENEIETETNPFTLRLPKDLDVAIQQDAQDQKRSKNSHIVFILEKHINLNSKQGTEQIALDK